MQVICFTFNADSTQKLTQLFSYFLALGSFLRLYKRSMVPAGRTRSLLANSSHKTQEDTLFSLFFSFVFSFYLYFYYNLQYLVEFYRLALSAWIFFLNLRDFLSKNLVSAWIFLVTIFLNPLSYGFGDYFESRVPVS